MTASLTASFVLKLEDKLSSGIVALTQKLERLSAMSKKLTFDGLDKARDVVDKVGSAAEVASRKVEGIGKSARSAVAELKRLSSQPIMINTGGTAFLPPSVTRAAMAATIAAAGVGGAGGHMSPASPSASFFNAPLQLAGSGGGGGIPLQFSPALMQISALRSGLSAAAGQARQLNHHLREAGHGALGALTTGFGLFEPVREYAAYENVLRHIAITANTPQAELPKVIGELTKQYNVMALATGQSAEKVAESANFLITTGIGKAAVDAMLPVVAKAATAYNTQIGDSVQAVFSLKENLHVSDADLPGTVSAMALAGKAGHFSFADMSRYLPDVAPLAGGAGLSGPMGARQLMAMEETSRRNAGTSGEANTNVRDFLSHLFGDPKRGLGHQFAGYGVDLNKVLLDAEKKGISAPEAVIEKVRQLTSGKTQTQTNLILGKLFHNQQSAQFARGWLHDMEYYLKLKKELEHADKDTINLDFLKAYGAPQVQLNQMQEALKQIVRRFGEGFAGLIPPITAGLQGVLGFLDQLDAKFPGMGNKVLVFTGGFLALMAVFGILAPLFGAIGAGFSLLVTVAGLLTSAIGLLARGFVAMQIAGGPILWIIEALAVAAFLVYQNWDTLGPRFRMIWADLQDSFGQFLAWVSAWIAGAMQAVIDNFKAAWDGLKGWFSALWTGIVGTFSGLIDGIERRITAIRAFLGLGGASGGQVDSDGHPIPPPTTNPNPADQRLQDGSGRPLPFSPIGYRPGGQVGFAPLEIKVTVDAQGSARVDAPRRVEPNRGPMFDPGRA